MKFKLLVFLILFSTFYFLLSDTVFAAPSWWPLVPCGLNEPPAGEQRLADSYYQPCTRCDTFRLIDNVIHFVLEGLVPPVAAILFVFAGLMILLGGAMPARIALGKTIFRDTFIGLVIILSSWLIANTFLKSFAPEQADKPWYRIVCTEERVTVGGPPISPLCSQPQTLAQQNSTPHPRQNAPELNTLISCVNSQLGQFIDQGQIYTFETENVLCNYTRGQEICGACKHSANSCHYGGANGTSGSLAVDFNAQGISEQDLYQRLQAISGACNFGYILFENTHTHVSTQSCSGN